MFSIFESTSFLDPQHSEGQEGGNKSPENIQTRQTNKRKELRYEGRPKSNAPSPYLEKYGLESGFVGQLCVV